MGIFRGIGGTGNSTDDGVVDAVTAQAVIATNKATEAATSATSAYNSAQSASTSKDTATTQANAAQSSANTASTHATNASTSATSAATSATSATSSATTATTKASEAATSATNAATSETNAATSATTATTKASEAATSATTATTKAGEASTSATNAASSATSASTSASTATTKASEASTSAASAASSYDSFDDRYLGAKSSAPSVDNDGDALITGALYFDTTSDSMKVYSGSAWLDAYASLSGALIATNNLSDLNNAGTARTNLGLGTAATTDASAYATAAQADQTVSLTGAGATSISGTYPNFTITSTDTNTTYSVGDGGLTEINFTSADNTKLDGIEAGATADQTAGEIKTAYESNADTNAFTDADHTKLDGIEASADVTDTTNVTAAGALMDSECTSLASVKALNQGVATTDSPSFAGLTVDTNTLHVDATNNRVGIGTSSPDKALTISASDSQVRLYDADGTNQFASFQSDNGITKITSRNNTSHGQIVFQTYNGTTVSERMRIDSSGRLGIGTSSPSRPLTVNGNNGTGMIINDAANDKALRFRATGNAFFIEATNNAESAYANLALEGNVGIGTSSPSVPVHVYKSQASPTIVAKFENPADEAIVEIKSKNTDLGILQFADTEDANVGAVQYSHSDNSMRFKTNDSERMRIDSSGRVGIGTSSPATSLHISSGTSGDAKVIIEADTDNNDEGDHPCLRLKQDGGLVSYRFGIGTSDGDTASSNNDLCVTAEGSATNNLFMVTTGGVQHKFWHAGNDGNGSGLDADLYQGFPITTSGNRWGVVAPVGTDGVMEIGKYIDFHETDGDTGDNAIRLDATSTRLRLTTGSGYVDIGPQNTTYSHFQTDRGKFYFNKRLIVDEGIISSYNEDLILQRNSGSNNFRLTTNGSDTIIRHKANSYSAGFQTRHFFGNTMISNHGTETGTVYGFQISSSNFYPAQSGVSGLYRDNVVDLGHSSSRWDDIYATNGTIQTSDEREKQDIEALNEAEQRVAVAAKGLLRKFRWKDKVAAKGDDARIHFGIIAQDLEAAFIAEGLDPSKYAMFIKTEWWVGDKVYPAIAEETDEEGNVTVEGREESTDPEHHYDNQADAPADAVYNYRMGIRYSELLAFIISAI